MSILKSKLLIFFTFEANSVSLYISSIKFILKFSKSFSVSVINGKQRCVLLFISLCSSNVALIVIDFHLILHQLLLFFKSVIPNSPHILLFIRDFLMSLSSLQVIKICLVSFFTDAGNNFPNGVNL